MGSRWTVAVPKGSYAIELPDISGFQLGPLPPGPIVIGVYGVDRRIQLRSSAIATPPAGHDGLLGLLLHGAHPMTRTTHTHSQDGQRQSRPRGARQRAPIRRAAVLVALRCCRAVSTGQRAGKSTMSPPPPPVPECVVGNRCTAKLSIASRWRPGPRDDGGRLRCAEPVCAPTLLKCTACIPDAQACDGS
jgi:hypothetical protein